MNISKYFKNKKNVAAVFLYMLLIFILSSLADKNGKFAGLLKVKSGIGDIFHIPLFAVLSFLCMRFQKKSLFKSLLYSAVITVSYGAIDEIHQLFTVGRSCSFTDLLLDATGCVLGLIIYLWRSEDSKSLRLR